MYSSHYEELRFLTGLVILRVSKVPFHPEYPAGVFMHSLSRQILDPNIPKFLMEFSSSPVIEFGFAQALLILLTITSYGSRAKTKMHKVRKTTDFI